MINNHHQHTVNNHREKQTNCYCTLHTVEKRSRRRGHTHENCLQHADIKKYRSVHMAASPSRILVKGHQGTAVEMKQKGSLCSLIMLIYHAREKDSFHKHGENPAIKKQNVPGEIEPPWQIRLVVDILLHCLDDWKPPGVPHGSTGPLADCCTIPFCTTLIEGTFT